MTVPQNNSVGKANYRQLRLFRWSNKQTQSLKLYFSLFWCAGNSTTIRDSCTNKKKYFNKITIRNQDKRELEWFLLRCTAETVFEVRYTNGQLCQCARYTVVPEDPEISQYCVRTLSMDFTVHVSVDQVQNLWGENCSFTFNFEKSFELKFTLGIPRGKLQDVATSSLVNPFPSKDSMSVHTRQTVALTRDMSMTLPSIAPTVGWSSVLTTQNSKSMPCKLN